MGVAVWPFVGREGDVAAAAQWLADGRSVFLAGPAGVGKTQLARAIADLADGDRHVVRHASSVSAGLPIVAPTGDGSVPLLVVDDAHELDADSASVLASMIVSGDVSVVATLRHDARALPALTTLWKDGHVERLDIRALTRADVDAVLDAVLEPGIDVATRRTLWELTHGSPLFLRELVRSSIEDGSLICRDAMWRLLRAPRSRRLDELVSDRVAELGDEVRVVVELVALGEPLPFEPFLAEVGVAALDAAELTGLVEVVEDDLRRDVRMVHPVFGDVVRRRLGAARTASLCGRLLAVIETTPMRRRDDIVRAATWQLRAGGTVVTDDMVLAARRALYDRNEWLAIELASRVVDRGTTDAALVLSEAFTDLGQPERADRLLRDLPGDLCDADRSLVAIQRAVTLYWGLGDVDMAEAVLVDAEDVIRPGPARDEVRAERAVIAATHGDLRRAMDIGGDLLAGDTAPRAFVTAAIAGSIAMALGGRSVDAAQLSERASAIGDGLVLEPGMSDPSIHVVARALALSESGDLAESEELSRAALELSEVSGHRHGHAWFTLVLGRTLLLRGRPSEARRRFAGAAGAFAMLSSDGPRRWALAGVVQAAVLTGDRAVAVGAWEELCCLRDHPARMMAFEIDRASAWLAWASGDHETAIAVLASAARAALDRDARALAGALAHDAARILALGGVGSARVRFDESLLASIEADQGRLGPLRARHIRTIAAGDAAGVETAAFDFDALGAALLAAEAYEHAGALHDRSGTVRSAARCRAALARVRRATGEEWLATLGASGRPDGVTYRELQVARLAADGRSNREIADCLGVSVRTVENHLQRVYDKLGIGSRRDLATAIDG